MNKGQSSEYSKEGSYTLFVVTCDDDAICYPVVGGRVEVPAGVRFLFKATSDMEGHRTHVQSFKYHGSRMVSRAHCVIASIADYEQEAKVTVIETRQHDNWAARRVVNITVVPILNDRSGAAAPVADVEVTPPLGTDVERERNGVMELAAAAKDTEKDALLQLVFYNPSEEFEYDSDARTVVIPAGSVFQVGTACSEHRIHWCTYRNQRASDAFEFVSSREPGLLKILVSPGCVSSCTVEVNVVPTLTKARYDGIILVSEPPRKGRVVPTCADAEGIAGKRFIPPWNDGKERACEECFLTHVVDPRGWTATTGSGACNYTPMRVWLENADDNNMPFAENEEGDYLVPYGTRVTVKTDRGEVSRISAGGGYHHTHLPFVFEPCDSLYWSVDIGISFPGPLRGAKFTFCLRTTETAEEIQAILKEKQLQKAIRDTTEALNHERECLEKTWERIQTAQDRLTELKVEQAKLASK
jgi:hypothetical protein